jgi:hypothetical protein
MREYPASPSKSACCLRLRNTEYMIASAEGHQVSKLDENFVRYECTRAASDSAACVYEGHRSGDSPIYTMTTTGFAALVIFRMTGASSARAPRYTSGENSTTSFQARACATLAEHYSHSSYSLFERPFALNYGLLCYS